ncbi:MAG: DUF362 domain-containing protein [Actinomycetota bacterium]
MDNSVVRFASVQYDKLDAHATLPAKFKRLLETFNLTGMVKDKPVALKMHLGRNLGYTTIHPLFVKILVDYLKETAERIFITDLDSSVAVARDRGYGEAALGVPIVSTTGLFDRYYYTHKVSFNKLKEVQVAGHIQDADILIDFSHLKGHGVCAYGGACKNIAMGCVTRKTRRDLHSLEGGINWDKDLCDQCQTCIESCRYGANKFDKEGNYEIFYHDCTYCQHCIDVCPNEALTLAGKNYEDFQEGMAIATREVLKTFEKGSTYYINFLLNITILCDCWGLSTPSLVPDIGILASDDIVAVEKASLDIIGDGTPLPNSLPEGRKLAAGRHLFEKLHGKDPYVQIEKLKKLELGNDNYTIEEIK